MKAKVTCCIYILALLFLFTACSKASETPIPARPTAVDLKIGDGGLLSDIPCGPPCFLGIQPEVTRYDEVLRILSENQDLDYCKEYDNTDDGGDRGIKCADSYIISFDPERIVVISLGFTPTEMITLQEVVEMYEEPAGISVSTGGYAKTTSTTLLFYPQYNMMLILEEKDGDNYLVQPSSKVDTIVYLGETSFQKSFEYAQEWSGYGEYIMQF